jgi:hypothetical protein
MAERTWGLVAEFENPAHLMNAAQKTREAGYAKFETWSPFPIHGMDRAMGLPGSKVGWIVLGGGLTGMTGALALQWWTSVVAYPYHIGGKPLFAWEWATPVTFELSILFSAFATVFAIFFLNKLPRPFHPLDRVARFRRVTDDAFFLTIEAADPKFDPAKARDFLASLGGRNITEVPA